MQTREKKNQTCNYYPFGLEHNGYNGQVNDTENTYQTFQGQETNTSLGINWHEWRYHTSDPTIDRFLQLDPLAKDYYYNSPYAFSENKVVAHVELEGLEAIYFQVDGRVSTPVSPVGLGGVTGALSYGVAVDKNGNGMFYKTTSLGVQTGVYVGGGVEGGIILTGTIENMKGYSLNAGVSLALNSIPGTVGPEGAGELNWLLPGENLQEIVNNEISETRLGGTASVWPLSFGLGATAYTDVSKTKALSEFNVFKEFDILKENIRNLYNEIKPVSEGDDLEQREEDYKTFETGLLIKINQALVSFNSELEEND